MWDVSLLAFALKEKNKQKAKKEKGMLFLENRYEEIQVMTNQQFAVFASLQSSAVYRREASLIEEDRSIWTGEKERTGQLYGVDWSGANLM